MAYDTDNFEQDVIQRSHQIPVLVDFWAEWCGPCRVLGPTLERMAAAAGDRWALVKLNTEHHQEVAMRYGIRSIPNVKLFIDGEVVNEFVGALPEPRIREWLQQALPSPYAAQIAHAHRLVQEGKAARAAVLLEEILESHPDEEDALVALAQAYLASDPARAAALAGRVEPGSRSYTQAAGLQSLAELLTRLPQAEQLPDAPVKAAFLSAVDALRGQDYGAALGGFIDVLRKQRRYGDDAPRQACIALFQLLGDDHPLTRRFRPLFASAILV